MGSHFDYRPKISTPELSVARSVGKAFIVVGILITLAGLIWVMRTMSFVRRTAKAPGQVVEMTRDSGGKNGPSFYPIFEFTDSSGISHTQRSAVGSSRFLFEPGDHVTVLYDVALPRHSEIESFDTIWGGPVFTTGFGVIFGGFAWFWLWVFNLAAAKSKLPDAATTI